MTVLDIIALLAAGTAAGTINAIVGSGSLITFPTLLALGYPALLANVTNNVGIVPGGVSAAIAYRSELIGEKARIMTLGSLALIGGVGGSAMLLSLPGNVFKRLVPALILVACVLVVLQPRLSRWATGRSAAHPHGGIPNGIAVFLTAVYGGYFGAAQGVILMSLLGIFIPGRLQHLNGLKNALVVIQNGAAALVFIAFSHVSWEPAGCIALGSVIGGQVGGHVGKKIPPTLLRAVIVIVGLTAVVVLLVS